MRVLVILEPGFDLLDVLEVVLEELAFDFKDFFQHKNVHLLLDLLQGNHILFEGLVNVTVILSKVFIVFHFSHVDQHPQLGLSQHEGFLEVRQFLLDLLHQFLSRIPL